MKLPSLFKSTLLLLIPLLMVSGCATSGINGTTQLSAKYDSTVDATGADRTIVDINAKGKAGDVLEAVSNATLDTGDGTGAFRRMTFGANQANDGTRRADSIDKMNEMWSAAFIQSQAQWASLLQAVAGQFIPEWSAVKQSGQAADVTKMQAKMQALEKALNALKQAKPEPVAPTPNPPLAPDVSPEPDPLPVEGDLVPVTE